MNRLKLIKKFNLRVNRWLLDLNAMSESSLEINPRSGSWSIAEVYDHIIRVARTYQIPNLKKSITEEATQKKRKNMLGYAIFNIGIRRKVSIKMEDFPLKLVEDFTPIKKNKAELVLDFKKFIKEVNELEAVLLADKKRKQYHPMFGDISTLNWFALIEIHMQHHENQKNKIKKHIDTLK